MFFFKTKKVKQILEEIINNRRMLTDVQEIKIVEHYVQQGKNFTVLLLVLLILMSLLLPMMALLPDILDIVQPLNESRTHSLLILSEYNVNEGIQYYSFFVYILTSIFVGAFSMLAIGTMLVLVALHCCAIFKICSCRIKQSVDKNVIAYSNERNVIVKRIIRTVELHRNAQKLFKLLISSFTISFLILLVIGMCSLVVNLYRLLYELKYMDNLIGILITIGYIGGHELYIFGTSFLGQLMVNHADEFFNSIYMSLWYKASITVQKLLLFIMQISSKSLVPSVGGIYVSVMESFTTFTKTSLSFMMVIYSLQ
ncbi:PREDICTED: uncharacterized protein LOC105462061 [Wasmannia auropunctata]|uniref:uncharacterized protein LOC105462061 n=1 Tax=Wasmannia auropunctata TaxID=64793 RepID=UPI0005ED7E6A|nr:PREDICTED: uncharacterized protein LOC105462061 [Wasmannia auropunctata]